MSTPEGVVRNRLKAVRTRFGLSQQELAAKAGVTRQTVGGIEASLYAPSASVALRMARALACRVEDLFWLEETLPPLQAIPAEAPDSERASRWTLGKVRDQWVAHPLTGDSAFRSEMVPADATGGWDGTAGAVHLTPLQDLQAYGDTVLLAACTPVLSLWAREAERWQPGLRVHWAFRNSTAALHALRRGEVHAAGIHFSTATRSSSEPCTGNEELVRAVIPEIPVALINLGIWDEGLLVAPGNPLRIRSVADLHRPGVRLVNRETGAGARHLLEQALRQERVTETHLDGWSNEVTTHQEVARAVAGGSASAGVSSAAVAAAYGLDFLPLAQVRYDLAIPRDLLEHPPVRKLLSTLDNRWVRSQLAVLGGYNTSRTGEVVAELGGVGVS